MARPQAREERKPPKEHPPHPPATASAARTSAHAAIRERERARRSGGEPWPRERRGPAAKATPSAGTIFTQGKHQPCRSCATQRRRRPPCCPRLPLRSALELGSAAAECGANGLWTEENGTNKNCPESAKIAGVTKYSMRVGGRRFSAMRGGATVQRAQDAQDARLPTALAPL